MSRKSKKRRPKQRQSKSPHRISPLNQRSHHTRRFLKRVIGLILGFATLLGGYAVIRPRISVSLSTPLNPANPFSTPFTASNDGYLSLYDVAFLCQLHRVRSDRFIELSSGEGRLQTTAETLVARKMSPGEKNDVPCIFGAVIDIG